jgi:hypothetical protein
MSTPITYTKHFCITCTTLVSLMMVSNTGCGEGIIVIDTARRSNWRPLARIVTFVVFFLV